MVFIKKSIRIIMVEEMENKLELLKKDRDKILFAEIGALIHDLGKLHKTFIEQHAKEYIGNKDYQHGDVLDEDAKRDDELGKLAKELKEILRKWSLLDSNLYEIIKSHHNKDGRENLPILLKLIIASDEFDSEEDRGGAKDKQSLYKTFKSSAFGYESEMYLDELEELRKRVYKWTIKILDTCNFNEIVKRRRELFDVIEECFSKTLGMSARSANDVLLWEHSYITATIMKCLIAQKILEPNFEVCSKHDIKDKKPFSVFTIGWNFFEFIEQSHKIPDIVGRIEILDEIKREIKHIIEVDYALGNEIYNDDFGIHFLIPSTLNGEDLNEIKGKIFEIFNCKDNSKEAESLNKNPLNGILLPIFALTTSEDINGDYKIGKLLSKSIEKLKEKIESKEYELLDTPKFTKNIKSNRKNNYLVCEICGKGVYNKNDNDKEKLCEICKKLREMGRKQKQPQQTVYVDEIAWNPKSREYEKICLLVAKFDLDNWLNGTYIESSFIRKPDIEKIQWLHDFYNSPQLCKADSLELNEEKIRSILSLGALNAYLYLNGREKAKTGAKKQIEKKCLKEFDKLDDFSKEELNYVKKALEKVRTYLDKDNLSNEELNDLKKIFKEDLDINKVIEKIKDKIKRYEDDILPKEDRKIKKQQIKEAKNTIELLKLFQKTASPSRIMRVWNTTKEFFNEVEKDICLKVPLIEESIIKIKDINVENNKNIKEGVAYIIEINELNLRGEAVYNKNSKELIVVTPHLSEIILSNKKNIKNKRITIKDSNNKEIMAIATIEGIENNIRKVRAFRTISKSPTMFMAIIPASKSFEIVKMIKAKYEKEFGKVYGKLPLHTGLIYGKKRTPMYVLLDSARRMLKKFDEYSKNKGNNNNNKITFKVKESKICLIDKTVKITAINEKTNFEYEFEVPFKLGGGNIDYYHPYLEVEVECSNNVICVYAGDKQITQKHVLKIEPEDKLKFNKYYFDFEYLDSNIRRLDLGTKRKHWLFANSENKPKPYLLWDLDNFERLNRTINKYNLTNTQIMNLYELLISKIDEWGLKNVEELKNNKEFKKFVENAILDVPLNLKGKITDNDKEFLINSILNGLFFDFVDLWHTILKKDLGGDKNE